MGSPKPFHTPSGGPEDTSPWTQSTRLLVQAQARSSGRRGAMRVCAIWSVFATKLLGAPRGTTAKKNNPLPPCRGTRGHDQKTRSATTKFKRIPLTIRARHGCACKCVRMQTCMRIRVAIRRNTSQTGARLSPWRHQLDDRRFAQQQTRAPTWACSA